MPRLARAVGRSPAAFAQGVVPVLLWDWEPPLPPGLPGPQPDALNLQRKRGDDSDGGGSPLRGQVPV